MSVTVEEVELLSHGITLRAGVYVSANPALQGARSAAAAETASGSKEQKKQKSGELAHEGPPWSRDASIA